eukprot:2259987-Prymnesium_polylepis.1
MCIRDSARCAARAARAARVARVLDAVAEVGSGRGVARALAQRPDVVLVGARRRHAPRRGRRKVGHRQPLD